VGVLLLGLFLLLACFTNYTTSSTIIGFGVDAVAGLWTRALILMERPPPSPPHRPPLHKRLLPPYSPSRFLKPLKLRKPTVDIPISNDAKKLLSIAQNYASKGNSEGVQTCLSYAFEFLHSDYKHIISGLTRCFHSTLHSKSHILDYESVKRASPAPALR